jgi:hypothetical protein
MLTFKAKPYKVLRVTINNVRVYLKTHKKSMQIFLTKFKISSRRFHKYFLFNKLMWDLCSWQLQINLNTACFFGNEHYGLIKEVWFEEV